MGMADQDLEIHRLAKAGNLLGVMGALEKGVSVDARERRTNRTVLMAAVDSGRPNVALVRALIARGADVNATASEANLLAGVGGLVGGGGGNPAGGGGGVGGVWKIKEVGEQEGGGGAAGGDGLGRGVKRGGAG